MEKATRRSLALQAVLERLEQMDRSVAWLARQLSLSRQTVHTWRDLPAERVDRIAEIISISAKTLRKLRSPEKPQQRAA